jgi:hypothetical protein
MSLRPVDPGEHRCVAVTLDEWGQQCELTGGHDGLHWSRGFAGGPNLEWSTGGSVSPASGPPGEGQR